MVRATNTDLEPQDKRITWLEQRLNLSLKLKPQDVKKLFDNEDFHAIIIDFLETPERRCMYVVGTAAGSYAVVASDADAFAGDGAAARKFDPRKKIAYFAKLKVEKILDEKSMSNGLIFGDMAVDALQSFHAFAEGIMLPLIKSKPNVAARIPAVCHPALVASAEALLAQSLVTVGRAHHLTLLPIPPLKLPAAVSEKVAAAEKPLVMQLEAVVTQWSALVREAITTTPEGDLAAVAAPGPLDEIAFWKAKAGNLRQLEEQLCRPFIAKVSVLLKMARSNYYAAFSSLQYELHDALTDAVEIHRYLSPVAELFELVSVKAASHLSLQQLVEQNVFRQIFHLLYVIWANCPRFSTVGRMVNLITELVNDVLENAKESVNVPDVFQTDTEDIVAALGQVLAACGEFKAAFFFFKAKGVKELQRPWRFQNTALFKKMDLFLERCHDLLDIVETAKLFFHLANLKIGGAAGIGRTTQIEALQLQFTHHFNEVQTLDYDMLDVLDTRFEADYDAFREAVKDLERQLGVIMAACLDEDPRTIGAVFKVVDSFEGFTARPVLHQEWLAKQMAVLKAWQAELLSVQDIFVAGKEKPACFANMPQTASAILWANGLLGRIAAHYARITADLSKAVMASDTGDDAVRLYDALRGQLRTYMYASYEQWASSVGQISAERLRLPLLVYAPGQVTAEANSAAAERSLLNYAVNFDAHLVRTLREVAYIQRLASEHEDAFVIPPQVVALNKQREQLRGHVLSLEYVCGAVDAITASLLPCEQALLEKELAQLDINLSRGVSDLKWSSSDLVPQYIADVVVEARGLEDVVGVLHANQEEMVAMFAELLSEDKFLPLVAKADVRIMTEQEFRKRFGDHMAAREERVVVINNLVNTLLGTSLDALNELKGGGGLPAILPQSEVWCSYLAHVSGAIGAAVAGSLCGSLAHLRNQLSEAWLQRNHGLPLFDIKLLITRPRDGNETPAVLFEPALDDTRALKAAPSAVEFVAAPSAAALASTSLPAIVNDAIGRILRLAARVVVPGTEADDAPSTFEAVVARDDAVVTVRAEIEGLVADAGGQCADYSARFAAFEFLYATTMGDRFRAFVDDRGATSTRPREDGLEQTTTNAGALVDANDEDDDGDGAAGAAPYFGVPLYNIDTEIRRYEELEDELEDLPAANVIAFVKVDSRPLKAGLLALCARWRGVLTSFITEKIVKDLDDLYGFMRVTDDGLNAEVQDGDITSLKVVMRAVRDCKRRNDKVQVMMEPVAQAALMLKQHPLSVSEEVLEKIEDLRKPAMDSWNILFRKSLNVREQNSLSQDREAENVKEETATFEERLAVVGEELRRSPLYTFQLPPDDAYGHIDRWAAAFAGHQAAAGALHEEQELFDLTPTDFRALKDSNAELVALKHVWDLVNHVLQLFSEWMTSPFSMVDVDGFLDEIKKLNKQLKTQPLKAKSWGVFKGLETEVANMGKSLPLCAELRSQAMRKRHWEALLQTAGQAGTVDPEDESFTLQRLIDMGVHNHAEDIYTIVEKAQKEQQIERALTKIVGAWESMAVEYALHQKLEIKLIAPIDAIVEQLEADANTLQGMLSNRFVDHFIDKVSYWQKNLGAVDASLTKWLDIQRKWVNLFPIFVLSADIREQLPEDARNFAVADETFRHLMRVAHEHTNVIRVICSSVVVEGMQRTDSLEAVLEYVERILVACEKALTDYLETKRQIFPRFYFVSSSDLVDILSKGSDPSAVMVHMSKIIDSVDEFLIAGNPSGSTHTKEVWEIVSVQGERVRLHEEYICDGAVEQWLGGCIGAMKQSIRQQVLEANAGYVDKPRTEWIYLHCCEAIIVASRTWFTTEVQTAFQQLEEGTENAVKDFLKTQKAQLDTLVKEVLRDQKSNDRKMLVHLITIDVHARDVVQILADEKTDSVEDFHWQSQLRYYWDDKRGAEIRICDAEFAHGYEYTGLCGCLVITPLTDRCYITLTQALKLKRGGAPAGPAGTGKTETTKDLARNLGYACYVFNCSDQMNYLSLGQIFKGLAMSGAWGCFDEFNRISIEVLSVVATQVGSILNALKNQKKRFRFMDEEIPLIPSVGMWITMNPGYAGRTELPENIKSLFRPCAMCVPDLRNICEIMLAAEGFLEARDLALKFVTLYRLNKELLSPQRHYDWGLRAVKSVLYIAGALKRGDPDTPERNVLMRALRDTNMAKLSKDDVYVFMGLITALFPRLEVPKKGNAELSDALKLTCKDMGNLTGENDIFILKCMQFEELLHVRHSVFVLGPAGSGKTQLIRCLQQGLGKMGDKCVTKALNPKAITSNELYGFFHPQTKEWKDGILSSIFRDFAVESKTKKNSKWIVLDGIIDAEWIESMNTVMDDNRMLTLVSNERIPLTNSMRMIFEISHLINASPATVSRAGVVFINETDLGWGPFKDKWIMSRADDKEATILDSLFDKFVPTVIESWKRTMKPIVTIMDLNVIQTICYLLEGMLAKDSAMPRGQAAQMAETYEKIFCFAVVWAFGGPLPGSDGRIDMRQNFSNWWRKEFPHMKMSDHGTIFDFYLDMQDFEWKPWADLVQPFTHDPEMTTASLAASTVQTADTVRMSFLMSLFVDRGKPVMLVGTAGTGKSNLVMSKLRTLDSSSIVFRVVSFNARTSSAGLQSVMEQNLEKRGGKSYGPFNRKKLVFFFDDMNMPAPDKYNTQEVIALVQQHQCYGFWYDRAKIGPPKEVADLRYVGAMNPKSGTFTILDRLLRLFAVFATSVPDKSDLVKIYGQILQEHLKGFHRDVKENFCTVLTNATIDLHAAVSKNFLPTAVKFHYQWNMREMFNIFQGLTKSNVKLHNTPLDIGRLWLHECNRTFRDRMTDEPDMAKYDQILNDIAKSLPDVTHDEVTAHPNLWGPFTTTKEGDENVYDQTDLDKANKYLVSKLGEYNESFARMDLVLFEQAIEHVCRICRITSNARGNALLVGVGGSGKQSLAKLASFINGHDVMQILVTSNYNINDFRTDVQEVYRKAGLKGNLYGFILTDSQIVSQDMLVYLNDMLASGNVPELFNQEERDGVIGSIMNEVKATGHPDYSNPDVCWDFFIEKVRTNMHMILCFSPVGQQFSKWCRQFPALSNTTVIDWFHSWPQEALRSVAARFLDDVDLGGEEMNANIAEFMSKCQTDVVDMSLEYYRVEKRRCYCTPKSFLELISLYKLMLARKRMEVDEKSQRLITGIEKIREAGAQVAQLQEVLKKEQVEVEEARTKTLSLMEHVGKEKAIVTEQNDIAEIEEAKTNKIVVEVESFQAECQKDLAAAQPLVEKALAALDTLDKNSLTELKSMGKPPEDVVMVACAVRVLTSDPKTIPAPKNRNWADAKKMMSNVGGWLKELQAFDCNNIPQACIDAVEVYVNNPAFDPNAIATKSSAASGLCAWVNGMNDYHRVRCDVKPKEERLAEATARLDNSKAALKKVQDKVADLKAKLDTLLKQYNDAVESANAIEAKAKKTRDKADLATRLVSGLADENVRWAKTIEDLKEQAHLLIGDVLLGSAFVSYIGPFSKEFRERVVNNQWLPSVKELEIPMSPDLDIVMGVLTTEATVASWNNEFLPSDRVSTENGSIVVNCTRWPLMIDPQMQGVKWIRTREEKNGLKIITPGGKHWQATLCTCIEEGIPCLLESLGENIEPILDNVLGRVTFKKGGKHYVKVGASDVEFNPKFRFYLQTKLGNPIYKPEVNAQTTLINFMVTEAGLEDQLLAVVVNQERPDLEEKRVALIRQMNTMTIELQQCEDGLLYELSNAKGDILENVTLVENLEITKKKSKEINASMLAAVETQSTIATSRLTYTDVAVRASLLFFQIDQLCKIAHMYQYSLEAFMVVFNRALAKAEMPEDKKDIAKRVDNVLRSITENVFAYVSRGLFERHKLIFSSLLCFAIMNRRGDIDRQQLDFLLRGSKKLGIERPETVAEWCTEPNWAAVQALAEVEGASPSFDTLPGDMGEHNRWRMWAETEKPEEEKLPTDWKNLTNFQKLLILRCLRPDRLTSALETFVADSIGRFFVSDQAVDISMTFKDSTTSTPLFFILSPGVDPVRSVEALGSKMNISYDNERLYNVSLGQGQEIVAERALEACFEKGGWAMLNNIHLVQKWLGKLEKKLDGYSEIYGKMRQIAHRKAMKRAEKRELLKAQAAQDAEAEEGQDEAAAPADDADADAVSDAEAGDAPAEDKADDGEAKEDAEEKTDAAEEAEEEEEDDDDEDDDPDLKMDGPKGSWDFRVFLSADPSDVIPIGVLQRSIKLTSEPPTGITANVKRALTNFSDEPWERSNKPTEYRGIMFAMCFFHAVVVERKKFGPQGWNRVYPFNVGDLTTCLEVTANYIDERPKVPWEDLRYVFGEIMYGGHITDDWDRVLCAAYLQAWIRPECVDGLEIAPGLFAPGPMSYQEYQGFMNGDTIPAESPLLYGLHPNAEINFRTVQADVLFSTINELQPKAQGGGESMSMEDVQRQKVLEIMERLPELHNLAEMSERLEEERSPQQHVFYQECELMNHLITIVKLTLIELDLGLKGALSMTSSMQQLADELFMDKVPEVWKTDSFASMRPLPSWFDNFQQRNQQLLDWIPEMTTPKVTMISLFFNPMSFLTAIMQTMSIQNAYDLDQMSLVVEVLKRSAENIDSSAREGCHTCGIVMEGARWDIPSSTIDDSKMKELYPRMPVVTIRSLPLSKIDRKDQYECPMYKTQARGPGFVVGLFIKSKVNVRKWVIAGVGLLLDVVE
jgi:dynein heavy chain